MEGGPPRFLPDFTCPAVLGWLSRSRQNFAYRAFTIYGRLFQNRSATLPFCNSVVRLWPHANSSHNPTRSNAHRLLRIRGFRLFPVRSPLLGESRLISLPLGTEMFQFPRLPPHALCVQAWVTGHDPSWVSPFGHLRIIGCLHLPGAFRSLPRPSSASDAKAFTVCP